MGTLHLLVLIVINLTGVQSVSSEWGVNYPGPICAVRGWNVRIPCSYFYPSSDKVETVRWCSMNSNKGNCDDPPYVYDSSSNSASEEFKYIGNKQSNCTLLISNVQFSHSVEYKFRFITNKNQWTGDPGVTLQVGALQMTGPPENETLQEGDSVNLTCAVNCSLSSPQFVWFKNNQRLSSVLHSSALTVNDSGNYSCALKTDEAVRSEMVRINFAGIRSVNSKYGVNYTGPICAVRGSNVRIPCTYFYPSSYKVGTVRWCSMNSNKGACADPPYVYDSSSNSTSEGFQYTGDKQSNCTLLISNVQFSHSAKYKFRFKTNKDNWTGHPGVTLQVGDLKLTGPPENETLKEGVSVNLTCAVSCSLGSPQFVWFKNNQRLSSVLHSSALTVEDSGNYSCALKTDEAVRSKMVRINFAGVGPSGWIIGLVVVVGIVVIFALIFVAVVYNRRKKVKARKESDDGKDRKTQVGESEHGEDTDPQTNQEVLQQEEEQLYASVHKPKIGKKKKAQIEMDGGGGRKTQVGNSAQSGLLQEDDVTYASVSIKPNKPKKRVISTVQLEEEDSVIYSAVATK